VILLTAAVERELSRWTPRSGVETIVTGVGPVEAACAIAGRLARQRYELVVNAGIAGAFDGAAAVGDGVAISDERFELALESGEPIVLPGGARAVERARSDPALLERVGAAGFAVLHGITVARVTSSEETAARLARAGAQAESMEGFAVLRAAERAGVPAIELRGISNRAGARARSGWDFEAGLSGLERVLQAFFASIGARAGTLP
jgi:futalosine hydrolase